MHVVYDTPVMYVIERTIGKEGLVSLLKSLDKFILFLAWNKDIVWSDTDLAMNAS